MQGCTFGQDNLHVQVGSNVASVIVTANQAAGGLRVENHASKRAQIALNEEDPIAWTSEARQHYRLQVAGPGDGRYLQGWHGPERGEHPFRWSMAESRLLLPVVPGKGYTVTLEVNVPKGSDFSRRWIIPEWKAAYAFRCWPYSQGHSTADATKSASV